MSDLLPPLPGLPASTAEAEDLAEKILSLKGPIMSAGEYRRLREVLGSQDEAAHDLGINRRTLGRYERGERPIPLLAALQIRRGVREASVRKARTLEAARGLADA